MPTTDRFPRTCFGVCCETHGSCLRYLRIVEGQTEPHELRMAFFGRAGNRPCLQSAVPAIVRVERRHVA